MKKEKTNKYFVIKTKYFARVEVAEEKSSIFYIVISFNIFCIFLLKVLFLQTKFSSVVVILFKGWLQHSLNTFTLCFYIKDEQQVAGEFRLK